MDAENWQRVRALFDALVERPPTEWLTSLDERGVGDPVIREEVLALLPKPEAMVLEALSQGVMTVDILTDLCQLPAAEVLAAYISDGPPPI